MAHRVAELIKSAEVVGGTERESLKREITSLILTVWGHVNELCKWRCVPGPHFDPDLLKRELFGEDPANLSNEEKAIRFDQLLRFFEENGADEEALTDGEESKVRDEGIETDDE